MTPDPHASDDMIAWWIKRLAEDLQFIHKATSTWNTVVLELTNGQRFQVTVEELPPSSKYKVEDDGSSPSYAQGLNLPQPPR